MTADRDDAACTGAVVRKPPVKERAGDELPTVRRALWRFDRGVDGERKARERGGQVMAGAGGSRVRLSTDNDSFLGRLRSVRRGRAAVWSTSAAGEAAAVHSVSVTWAGDPGMVTESASMLAAGAPFTVTLRSGAPSGGRKTMRALMSPRISHRSVCASARRSE